MRLIHRVHFTPQEIESYRQLVFNNVVHGLVSVLEAMRRFDLRLLPENTVCALVRPPMSVTDAKRHLQQPNSRFIHSPPDLRDGESFPISYLEPLLALWKDPSVQSAFERGNEAALPEKSVSMNSIP